MKERPIIFSAPMVRAILAGAKTQTRRVVKRYSADCIGWFDDGDGLWAQRFIDPSSGSPYLKSWRDRCPHGLPGNRLWVRETWGALPHMLDGFQRESLRYRADGEYQNEHGTWRWRPSIHMPRWASRITLEVTGVRVERLQDISAADAIAEGIEAEGDEWRDYLMPHTQCCLTPRSSYRTLWESIHGPGSWDANPWVWVIEFRRIEA